MDLKKLAREINSTYGEPFLPAGFVRAQVRERPNGEVLLNLRIGDRDADFDSELKCIGAGTKIGDAGQYSIQKL